MANSIATIQRQITKMIDTVCVQSSSTEILEGGSKYIDLDFKEAGYVKIYNILMDGLSWYYRANSVESSDPTIPSGALAGQLAAGQERDSTSYARYAPEYETPQRDGFSRGSVKGGWEIAKLDYYRAKQFVVDQMDDEETAGMIIGNLLTEFVRTKVVPEIDEVRFNRLIQAAAGVGKDDLVGDAESTLGNLVKESVEYDDLIQDSGLSSKSMIAKFNRAFVWLQRREVPEEEQVIFASEDVWGLLLGDPLITRFFDVAQYKSESGVTFEVKTYMGRPIIHVPDSRFYTDPVLGDNGYHRRGTSRKINFIVCSKKSIVPVVKLDYTKIWTPETQDDFIGYKVNFAIYHDAFIPRNKKISIYASISDSAIADGEFVNALGVQYTERGNNVFVNDYVTQPAGLLGSLVVTDAAADPYEIGSDKGVSAATPVVLGTTEIAKPTTTGHSLYFALVSHGKTIAKSTAVLTK